MTETTAAVLAPRRGHTHTNAALDLIVEEAGWLTTDELTELLVIDTVIGAANTPSSGPVGRWVLGELQGLGHPAVAYSWMSVLTVYGADRVLLGEVHVPSTHTLWDLECEVNDLGRPELCHQGERDER